MMDKNGLFMCHVGTFEMPSLPLGQQPFLKMFAASHQGHYDCMSLNTVSWKMTIIAVLATPTEVNHFLCRGSLKTGAISLISFFFRWAWMYVLIGQLTDRAGRECPWMSRPDRWFGPNVVLLGVYVDDRLVSFCLSITGPDRHWNTWKEIKQIFQSLFTVSMSAREIILTEKSCGLIFSHGIHEELTVATTFNCSKFVWQKSANLIKSNTSVKLSILFAAIYIICNANPDNLFP